MRPATFNSLAISTSRMGKIIETIRALTGLFVSANMILRDNVTNIHSPESGPEFKRVLIDTIAKFLVPLASNIVTYEEEGAKAADNRRKKDIIHINISKW